MDIRELAAHLARRSRLIAACVAASLLLAVGYLLIVPAEYLGVASLLIDPNANGSLTADTGFARAQPDPSMVENQVKLVISDNVLRRVVDHENLISDIEFGQRPKGIIAQILERFGLSQPASDDPITAAITTLRDHVFTRRSERTFVIDIGVYAREARKSARLTDALAQAFIDEGTDARVAFARQQSDEIKTRLAELKARIEAAETRVEQYKTLHSIYDNDGRTLTAQQFTDAERDLAQAHLRVAEAKARLDQLRASLAAGRDPASLPDALRSPAIERKRVTAGTTAITVKLDNTGTIQAQTGVIGVQGPYTESPAATLAISLSALPPGTGFGKIQFTAKPTFAGKFTLGTLNGYRPNPGDSFFVIGYPSAAGDFTSFNGLDLGSGLRLAPRFSASGLTLVATSYPVNPVPSLTLDRSVSGVLVAWPVNFTGWQLQSTTNLAAPSWTTTVPVTGSNSIVLPFAVPQQYFRLFQ